MLSYEENAFLTIKKRFWNMMCTHDAPFTFLPVRWAVIAIFNVHLLGCAKQTVILLCFSSITTNLYKPFECHNWWYEIKYIASKWNGIATKSGYSKRTDWAVLLFLSHISCDLQFTIWALKLSSSLVIH